MPINICEAKVLRATLWNQAKRMMEEIALRRPAAMMTPYEQARWDSIYREISALDDVITAGPGNGYVIVPQVW